MGDAGREANVSGVGSKTVVLVIGSLGELVKKSIETDLRVLENPKDSSLYLEALSLRKIIEGWPTVDNNKTWMLSKVMRLSIEKYKVIEKELDAMLKDSRPNTPGTWMLHKQAIGELFKRRDEIKMQMAELNRLSGGVGKADALPLDADFLVAKVG